ncbi:MAG: chromosomal replication initiator protein DnaA [Armatimonadota bacterium]|nr:chromosomal replication initiator protein DnaA [Armatimonadota bacterium]MCX7776452.1 chromosomal replication initiator protein DnaA [Armatimonadota bacterium]MDW8024250.1 chromosomal replication initiator protein DnaA [Armatimonadota bacterium]
MQGREQASLEEIWEKSLKLLQERVSGAAYKSWMRSMRPTRLQDSILIITVPNQFTKDLLESRYKDSIEKAISEVIGRPVSIQFCLGITQLELPLNFSGEDFGKKTEKLQREGMEMEEKNQQHEKTNDKTPQDFEAVVGRSSGKELREHVLSISTHYHSNGSFDDIPTDFSSIPLNPKYTFERFVVGRSNSLSHAAAWSVAHHPAEKYNPLFIYGGVGLGKTHLMHAIGHKVREIYPNLRVAYVSGETFLFHVVTAIREDKTAEFRRTYRGVDVWLVDDIQFIASAERTEVEFFHIFNELYDTNRQIVICSDRPPKELNLGEARLRSRFEWGLITEITPPDLEHRIAILQRKAREENVNLPEDVALFMAQSIQTNIRVLEGALTRVIAYASLIGKPITLEIAREGLRDYCDLRQYNIELRHILKVVAEHFNITVEDLRSAKRNRSLVQPRHIAMYLAREMTTESLSDIGRAFGKDHTSVIYAYEKIREEIHTNQAAARLIDELKARVEHTAQAESLQQQKL